MLSKHFSSGLSLCILYFFFHKGKDTSAVPQPSVQYLVYILINALITPTYGGFPLGKMIGEFAAKYIWACALTFVYSSTGEIFLFKIVKMNLTNLRRKKSPQLLDQSKHILLALPVNTFSSDQSKDGCE